MIEPVPETKPSLAKTSPSLLRQLLQIPVIVAALGYFVDIYGLVDSEYVTDRLKEASDPAEVIEAIRDGMQVVLD
jgi:hypothetical protein